MYYGDNRHALGVTIMKVIGLTGGIGSGKTTLSRFLSELGAVVIDADLIGHEVLEKSREAWRELVDAFGEEILTPEGEIDRKKLAALVFADGDALTRLNRIMHPRIYRMLKDRLEEYRRQGTAVVVVEAPLLLEAGWISMIDRVWVTVAPEFTVLRRLKGRGGLSEREIRARIRAQMRDRDRLKHAHVIINTECSLDELKVRAGKLWQELVAET